MKILQNWLKISWFSLTVKFVCEGPVANFTLPLLKVYDKELLWIEATWIILHGESVLLCFPYVTEQWNLRGVGGWHYYWATVLPFFFFSTPSSVEHLWSLSSLLQDWELNDVSSVHTTWEGVGGGGGGERVLSTDRQMPACPSHGHYDLGVGWEEEFFCFGTERHISKSFSTQQKICPCGPEIMFSCILLKILKLEMVLVAKGLQPASLAGNPGPWEAGSTAGDTVGVSQCVLHHSLSEVFPTSSRYEWSTASSSYPGILAIAYCC